ncbi:MAG: ferrous iron transport protein A [Fastidiosipila sp.]|nr:ferrous iron transport protein A [Fastidiosipila sp.]
MALSDGKVNTTYIIKEIEVAEEGLQDFLFSLGCYPGEEVTIISKLSDNIIINVKDARYSIDSDLAKSILV